MFEAAGGIDGLRRLAAAWRRRVIADEVVGHMANTANVLRAAEIARMDRDNHYLWLRKDPEYAAAFEIAWNRGADALEAEAVRRASEGVAKPVFHGGKRAIDVVQNPDGSIRRDESGKPIGIPAAVREYSDTLLIFLLKGRNPAVFGDRLKQEHSGSEGGPLQVIIMPSAEE